MELNEVSIKRFSVVVPLYNKKSHIRATLISVLEQTFCDFEVLVIDDGCTDGSADEARSLADPRIRIISQKKQGVSAARNLGIEKAVGEYVAFLDADDHWNCWHLSELDDLICRFPHCALYSTAYQTIRKGRIYRPPQAYEASFSGIVEDFFGDYAVGLSLVNSSTACIFRQAFGEVRTFPIGKTRGEDVIVWISAALSGGMAHSARVSVTINESAENRVGLTLDEEIPYFMIWLDNALNQNSIELGNSIAARKFLEKAIFRTAAGYKLLGNNIAFDRLKTLKLAKGFKLRMSFAVLDCVPRFVLRLIRDK